MNKRLKFVICNFEEIIAAVFIFFMTILVIINVFLRYVVNTGLYWSEEVVTGCFVWAVFLGASACYRRKAHVGVDILVNMLPENLKKIVNILVDIILILINGYITYLTILYLETSYTKTTPVLGISSVYISSSILVAFSLMTVYSVMFFYQDITNKNLPDNGIAKEETL